MSHLARQFLESLGRSIAGMGKTTAHALTFETSPTAASRGPLHFWSASKEADIRQFALGSDKDIGGYSEARLDFAKGLSGSPSTSMAREVEGGDGHAKFSGMISTRLPKEAMMQRSGYVAMRNKQRPTLFAHQTWDASLYRYLVLRVRNGLPTAASAPLPLTAPFGRTGALPIEERAKRSLGWGAHEPDGPKYFVNIQTDGPVTSDLFQHRIWLDPSAGNQWQTVVIPFDAFLLLHSGMLSSQQIAMLSTSIRTIGISCILETPRLLSKAQQAQAQGQTEAEDAPSALRRSDEAVAGPISTAATSEVESNDEASLGGGQPRSEEEQSGSVQRGSKRVQQHKFELGIQSVSAVGTEDEARGLWT